MGGRGRNSILSQANPCPSPSSGLQWGTRWAWPRLGLCPAGAPVERNLCPTPGASMSCTGYARVRSWHLGVSGRKGRGGRVLNAGCPAMGAGKRGPQRGQPASGQASCPHGVQRFLAGPEGRRSVPAKRFLRVERRDCFLGQNALRSLRPRSSPASDVFPAQMDGVKLVINKVLSSHFQVLPLLWPLLLVPPGLWEGGCGALLTSLACGTYCRKSGDPLHMLAHLGFSKACWMGRG